MTRPLLNSNINLPARYNTFIELAYRSFPQANNQRVYFRIYNGQIIEFCHFDALNGGDKNGLWLKVTSKKWLFVLINETNLKKAVIWSTNNLEIQGYFQKQTSSDKYRLPPEFDHHSVFLELRLRAKKHKSDAWLLVEVTRRLDALLNNV
jgi:hypothetical protein